MAKLNRTINVNSSVTVNSKTPQVNALVEILKAATANTEGQITELQLQALLMTEAASKLRTRQDPWLIFSYYRRQLVDAGFLMIEGLRRMEQVAASTYWNYEGC